MTDRVRVVPAYGDDGRSGAYQATGLSEGAAVAWIARTDAPVVAAPVLAGDTLIVADADASVYAFDAATGAPRWRYAHRPYDEDLDDEYDDIADERDDDWLSGLDEDDPGVVTAPAVWNTWVFVEESDSTGWVYVHDLGTGEVVGVVKGGGCPTVVGDVLLLHDVAAGARALRLPELTRIWRSEEEPAGHAGRLRVGPAIGDGGVAYAALGYESGRSRTGVAGFELATGELVFHRAGGEVRSGDASGETVSFDTSHAVAAQGLVWMAAVRYSDADPSPVPRVVGMDPRTGQERWVFEPPSGMATEPSAVAVWEGMVYVVAGVDELPEAAERLYAVDIASREPRWSAALSFDRVGSPVLAGGAVYLAGWNGEVAAFDARDGGPLWTVETGAEIGGIADAQEDSLAYYEEDGPTVLPGDGILYVRTADGVVALR